MYYYVFICIFQHFSSIFGLFSFGLYADWLKSKWRWALRIFGEQNHPAALYITLYYLNELKVFFSWASSIIYISVNTKEI